MTKKEFIKYYQSNSKLSDKDMKYFLKYIDVVKCNCGEFGCKGWAMISKPKTKEDILGVK